MIAVVLRLESGLTYQDINKRTALATLRYVFFKEFGHFIKICFEI